MALKIKKFAAGLLAVLFIIMALVLAVRAAWNFIESRKFSAARENAKKNGVALLAKELIPKCPESENAAGLLKAAWALVPRDAERVLAYRDAIPALFEGRLLDGEAGARLAEPQKDIHLIIELLEEASRKSCFRLYPLDLPLSERDYGDVGSIRAMQILAINAALLAKQGQIEAALNQCRIGLRLPRMLLDEPDLMNGLIAVANSRACAAALSFILHQEAISPGLLKEWIKELDPIAFRERFARIIAAERIRLMESETALLTGETVDTRPNAFWVWLARPLLKAQTYFVLKMIDDLEIISTQPYHAQSAFHKDYARKIERRPTRLLKSILPNYQSAFLKEAVLEATLLTMRTGLACRLYKFETGKYPDTLEALVPGILAEVPIDPFTGKSLVYRLENGLPLIYSLGSNGKDDGGRSTFSIEVMVASKDDDWTWRETVQP